MAQPKQSTLIAEEEATTPAPKGTKDIPQVLPGKNKPVKPEDIQPEQKDSSGTDSKDISPESIKKMSLTERLLMIESEIKDIKRTGQNINEKTGEVRYTFVEQQTVMNTVRPLLTKYRVIVRPQVIDHKLINRTGYDERAAAEVSRGVKVVVKMTFTFINVDKPTETEDIQWFAEGDDWGDKGTNKATTIAQKNMYIRRFNIADDDPDAVTPERAGVVTPTKTVSPDKVTIINTMLRRLKQSPADFEKRLGKDIEKMTNAEADDAIARMEAVISRKLAEEAANA